MRCVAVRLSRLRCCSLAVGAPSRAPTKLIRTRPIRLLVGFGAGGPTDIPARFVADKLGDALGQPVVVENKPAAAGIMATRDVLAQPADGYTLLLCTHFDPINVAMYRNVGFKLSDLAPISLIAEYYYGLALANAIPADDFESLRRLRQSASGRCHLCDDRRRLGAGDHGAAIAKARRHHDEPDSVSRRHRRWCRNWSPAGSISMSRRRLRSCRNIRRKQLKILATTSPERLEGLAGSADAAREWHRFRPLRLARHLRRGRHAGADHQDAARSDRADRRHRRTIAR